jgi:hypothetical protein
MCKGLDLIPRTSKEGKKKSKEGREGGRKERRKEGGKKEKAKERTKERSTPSQDSRHMSITPELKRLRQ